MKVANNVCVCMYKMSFMIHQVRYDASQCSQHVPSIHITHLIVSTTSWVRVSFLIFQMHKPWP